MAGFPTGLYSNIGIITASVVSVVTIFLIRGIITNSKRHYRRPGKTSKRTKDIKYITADERVLSRFSRAIQLETVSWARDKSSPEELLKFHALLKEVFPTVHSSPLVKREVINQYSLLFTVTGSDPSLKPYLLISHLDVVPVTDQQWDVPPFSGEIKDGFIWGRGTIDVKNGVMGSLEALEFLLNTDYCPRRGFFLSFGHDEEIHGPNGAAKIADELISRGVSLEFVQDEGLVILDGVIPGVTKQIAGIGVAEKGHLGVELLVECSVGHASMPPKETSIGILAKAVARIEANPMPSTFGYGPEEKFFRCIAHELPFPSRVVASNPWLFRPLLSWMMSQKDSTNGMARTTITVTKINGGTKENVIPASATAMLNVRIHHGDTPDSVVQYLRSCIRDDRVQIKIFNETPTSPIASSDDSFGYNAVASSILDVFPDVTIAPGLLVASTDSKHFLKITPNVYRFMPTIFTREGLQMFHGSNERISIKNYEQTINFYYRLMLNADESSL